MWPAIVLFALGLAIWVVGMPWARRRDARIGAEREAAGKAPSIVPKWVAVLLAFAAIAIGVVVYNLH